MPGPADGHQCRGVNELSRARGNLLCVTLFPLSWIYLSFSTQLAASPGLRWYLNHVGRMPPALQHPAGAFRSGECHSTGAGHRVSCGAPLRLMLHDCPPVLCCLRSHRSRQMVAALTAHRPQSLLSGCQLGSPAFPLMPLAWRRGPGAVGGVGRQQWGWEGDGLQRSHREVLMSTLRHDLR